MKKVEHYNIPECGEAITDAQRTLWNVNGGDAKSAIEYLQHSMGVLLCPVKNELSTGMSSFYKQSDLPKKRLYKSTCHFSLQGLIRCNLFSKFLEFVTSHTHINFIIKWPFRTYLKKKIKV